MEYSEWFEDGLQEVINEYPHVTCRVCTRLLVFHTPREFFECIEVYDPMAVDILQAVTRSAA